LASANHRYFFQVTAFYGYKIMWQRYRERLRKNSKPAQLVQQKKVLTLSIDCCSIWLVFSPKNDNAAHKFVN
jgi:hypothetical protein